MLKAIGRAILIILIFHSVSFAQSYYVATRGNDNNPGTLSRPWKTIQKAADTVGAGSTVYVRGGIYREKVSINVSGSSGGGYITFRNYTGETPVVDGTGLAVSGVQNGLFLIVDRSYIIIRGFEIRNYRTSQPDVVPVGINIRGAGSHIQVRDNRVHDIETNARVDADLFGADAHGIAVYGTAAPKSLNNIIIDGNELYDLKLGSSEALVLNGNVENFTVSGNIVHDVDNIAIDFIGFEGTSPETAYDQARNGIAKKNKIYNVSSYGNPAYGEEYSAGGIYVDGGKDIIIEMNTVYKSDIGVEIASEHRNRATSNITVRNNFLFNNRMAGIAMGGYDKQRGSTEDCVIVHNTLYNNDTLQDGNGEIGISFDTRNNVIKNNIIYTNDQNLFIGNTFTKNSGNEIDNNLYFSPGGKNGSEWQWKGETFESFPDYREETGNDENSIFKDPNFVNRKKPDIHLKTGSPAIDVGEELDDDEAGDFDIDGDERILKGAVDIGADEFSSGSREGSLSGTVQDSETEKPIINATVKLKKGKRTKKKTRTRKNGAYTIRKIKSGIYSVQITKKGYKSYEEDIEIKGATAGNFEINRKTGVE